MYQIYLFRQATQTPEETIDQFYTRLRRLAQHCEFQDIDFEIKMQIVCNGTSSRLRKRALRDATYSLENMLIDGRKAETSTAQATGIEAQQQPHEVRRIHQQRANKTCYFCGLAYPDGDKPCPAKDSVCNSCGNRGHFSKVCQSGTARTPQPHGKGKPQHLPPRKSYGKPRYNKKTSRKPHQQSPLHIPTQKVVLTVTMYIQYRKVKLSLKVTLRD